MPMIQKWNYICKELIEKQREDSLEDEYEMTVYNHFRYALEWYDCIKRQDGCVYVGTEKPKRPDMLATIGDIRQFVVEVKRPGKSITEQNRHQLRSYINELYLRCGLLIGKSIELYYKFSNDAPVLIKTFEFQEDTKDGARFVELFGRRTFSPEVLREYCECELAARKQEDELKTELEILCSEQGRMVLKGLVADYLADKGYDRLLVEEKMNDMVVSASRKLIAPEDVVCDINADEYNIPPQNDRIRRRRKYFSLNGSAPMGCGVFALAVVKQFVRDNPHLTYYEIRRALPPWAKIRTKQEIKQEKSDKNDERFEERWFMAQDEMMCSSDGKIFALTNQWSAAGKYPSDILPMIDFARRQGYVVEEV